MNGNLIYLIVLILTFLLTVAILRKLIPYLKEKKIGQKILEIGPNWHKSKEGTPTMGGLFFVLSAICVYLLFNGANSKLGLVAISITFAYMIVGFLDDFIKIKFKDNQGLKAYQKILFQFSIAVISAVFIYKKSLYSLLTTNSL